MRATAVELRTVRMPLPVPLPGPLPGNGGGRAGHRDLLLVRVETTGDTGWGECGALEAPVYSAEYLDGARNVLRRHLVPMLLAAPSLTAASVTTVLAGVRGHPMAKGALEMAVLDAELRTAGVSLAARLGADRDIVEAGAVVGIAGSVAALLDEVAAVVDAGYRRVKLKIGPGWDVEPLSAVRERFGDGLLLQADANQAYDGGDIAALASLDAFGLLCLEQPLAQEDLLGHAELAARVSTPICLDESITSARAADAVLALGACSVVNIKAARVGGYLEAVRVHDVCVERGVPAWCGGMYETGLGRAANLALAALPGFTLPGDLSASDRYYGHDLTPPFVLEDGRLRVPDGPGIGVEPLADVLDNLTTSVETLTSG